MGTEFEREVKRIFDERDFRQEQKAIKEAQEALAAKKEERRKKRRRQYLAFRSADRLCLSVAGVLSGLSFWMIFDKKPVASILLALSAIFFVFSSSAFCELSERANRKN